MRSAIALGLLATAAAFGDPQEELDKKWGDDWGFSGISTFAHLPHTRCLQYPNDANYDIAILGAPFDTAVTYRPGARFGPRAIRAASQRMTRLRGYNARANLNPFTAWANIIDCGDIPISPFDNALALRQMTEAYNNLALLEAPEENRLSSIKYRNKPKLLALGGDHSIALPTLRALNSIYGPVAVVHFDAHLDTWHPAKYPSAWIDKDDPTEQSFFTHGTMFWLAHNESLIAKDKSVHAGLRTRLTTIEDNEDDTAQGWVRITTDDIDDLGVAALAQKIVSHVGTEIPVYLSLDIDVIDPGLAPATGTPEPGGWSTREVIRILRLIDSLNVVGADVVEVSPGYDGAGEVTSLAAAQIVYEILTSMVKRGLGDQTVKPAFFLTSQALAMETFLRTWREDALSKHQYESAIFVGNKVLALTNSDSDAIALAQIHFAAANYTRALSFVSREDLIQRSPACKYLAAHCHVKHNRYEEALQLLGDKNPTHLSSVTDSARRKLQHLERSTGLKSLKPKPRQHERIDRSEDRDLEETSSIKYEAGMCYLRGLCYAKQNAFDKAKECYKDAVRIDVQCFEAFDQLTKNALMSPEEEWKFLSTLNFDTIPQDDSSIDTANFTRNLYITRLSKYARPEEFAGAIETLSSHYKLAENADILLAKADMLYTSSRYQPALALTSRILAKDPYNFTVIPLHLALLHHLHEVNTLFSLSHDLADTHPQEPCSWLAVGTYYLTINRIPEARSYFSKASLMDPHFGPAWIGFAHTFAAEGESEQAIAAYSTAARLFQGTHLPQLFLGMQEITIGNLTIAKEYLSSAFEICERDPLLLNEIGVVAYMEEDYNSACRRFQLALEIAKDNEAPPQQYLSTRLNLAQAHRKAGRYEEALDEFDEVIRLGCRDCSVFSSKALVLLELEQAFEAVVILHEALAISPQDPIASELLSSALRLLEETQVLGAADEDEVDQSLQQHLELARQKNADRSKRKPRARRAFESMELDGFQDP